MKENKRGAGRKPSGPIKGKIATFSTRITATTRGELEAEATASGQSISQIAEQLLQLGIETRRGHLREGSIRALAYLLEATERECRSNLADGRQCAWRNDRTMFEAFRHAVILLLDHLRPAGDIDASLEGPLIGGTPEQAGGRAFRQVWASLSGSRPMTPGEVDAARAEAGARPLSSEMIGGISRVSFALDDVRKALKIGEGSGK